MKDISDVLNKNKYNITDFSEFKELQHASSSDWVARFVCF